MAEPNYFKISRTADSGGVLTVAPARVGQTTDYKIWCRKQGETEWTPCVSTNVQINAGETYEFKGQNNVLYVSSSDRLAFTFSAARNTTGVFEVSGDITTLLNETGNLLDLTGRPNCFRSLFSYSDSRKQTKMKIDNLILPSMTLSEGCYRDMFVAAGANNNKFVHGDQNEDGAVVSLPAKTLAADAYLNMFYDCKVVQIKAGVKADQLGETNSKNWLHGVAAAGTFESTDSSFDTAIARSGSTIPEGWTITKPEPETGLWLNTKKVNFLFINGKQVAELYINGKQVGYEAPEPPGPDPKLTNFRITNIGNATDNPDDAQQIEVELPPECDMQIYRSDSGAEGALTPGETATITLPYGEYLEFWGNNEHGLYPDNVHMTIHCPEEGSYEASGQLSSLAMQDTKEVGYSFYGLFDHDVGLRNADNLVLPEGYDGCSETFRYMFHGCYNLQKGPEDIPQANGTDQFAEMFSGCTSLMTAGVKWTTWPRSGTGGNVSTTGWLDGVSAAGVFKCPAALTIPSRDENGVLSGWTIQNT